MPQQSEGGSCIPANLRVLIAQPCKGGVSCWLLYRCLLVHATVPCRAEPCRAVPCRAIPCRAVEHTFLYSVGVTPVFLTLVGQPYTPHSRGQPAPPRPATTHRPVSPHNGPHLLAHQMLTRYLLGHATLCLAAPLPACPIGRSDFSIQRSIDAAFVSTVDCRLSTSAAPLGSLTREPRAATPPLSRPASPAL